MRRCDVCGIPYTLLNQWVCLSCRQWENYMHTPWMGGLPYGAEQCWLVWRGVRLVPY